MQYKLCQFTYVFPLAFLCHWGCNVYWTLFMAATYMNFHWNWKTNSKCIPCCSLVNKMKRFTFLPWSSYIYTVQKWKWFWWLYILTCYCYCPRCDISHRFAIKMLSMANNCIALWFPGEPHWTSMWKLQVRLVSVQFICSWTLIFNIYNISTAWELKPGQCFLNCR